MTDKFKKLFSQLFSQTTYTYEIFFNIHDNSDMGYDSTEFDANGPDELFELWEDFCNENKIPVDCLVAIERRIE